MTEFFNAFYTVVVDIEASELLHHEYRDLQIILQHAIIHCNTLKIKESSKNV